MTKFIDRGVPVVLSYREVLVSILKWITVDGRPLDIINDVGFEIIRKIIWPMDPKLPAINEKNIQKLITNVAASLRTKMRSIFENDFLSLKIDAASYHSRKFLGIMCQARDTKNMNDFNAYTLGCVELFSRQGTTNLRDTMIALLEKYGISEAKILSLTTDNAPNISNVSSSINASHAPGPVDESEGDDDDIETDFEIEEIVLENDEEEADLNWKMKFDEFKRFAVKNPFLHVIGRELKSRVMSSFISSSRSLQFYFSVSGFSFRCAVLSSFTSACCGRIS